MNACLSTNCRVSRQIFGKPGGFFGTVRGTAGFLGRSSENLRDFPTGLSRIRLIFWQIF